MSRSIFEWRDSHVFFFRGSMSIFRLFLFFVDVVRSAARFFFFLGSALSIFCLFSVASFYFVLFLSGERAVESGGRRVVESIVCSSG